MVDKNRKLSLEIKNITVEEAKKIMVLVRGFDENNPERVIFSQIKGLEEMNVIEASNILKEIFPSKKTAR